ncbi:hypothetical protein [Streptomyces sp. CA-106131]|jgi:hypothetical protein|uniref:hypothetical protein n=1 Tax=Streptomyces sp. CA-106131 TaxID=3240045 RepID=UPI003D8B2F15
MVWFARRRSSDHTEADTAKAQAEQSLLDAKAKHIEVEAKLTESREVRDEIRSHNQADTCSGLIESIVLVLREH